MSIGSASCPIVTSRGRDETMTAVGPLRWYTRAVAIVFALGSALMYGVSDYYGGRHSRTYAPITIALAAELSIAVIFGLSVPLVESTSITSQAMIAGAIAGLCGSAGVLGLYAALARGNMTIVAPVTGVVAAAFPVVVGVLLGERPGPAAAIGIVAAIAAVGLIGGMLGMRGQPIDGNTIVLSIVVGALFGGLFIAYAQAGDDAGLWPILGARFGAVPLLVITYGVARRAGTVGSLGLDVIGHGIVIGVLIGVANAAYLFAAQRGLLSVVAVVVALYPAATIALAMALDGERAVKAQVVGMVIAVAAVVLITIGS